MIHQNKGAIFGLEADYGSQEYFKRHRTKLYRLHIKSDEVIQVILHQNVLDDEGDEIPALVSDSEFL